MLHSRAEHSFCLYNVCFDFYQIFDLDWHLNSIEQVSRLREPRQLFPASNPSLGPQQLPRWPAELQVAVERIYHSFITPQTPEAFYVRSKNDCLRQMTLNLL